MLKTIVLLSTAIAMLATPVSAMPRRSHDAADPAGAGQSPNNAGMVVTVSDQAGLVVKDARVRVTNAQTGAVREATSGGDGSASFPGLSLTGTYTLLVTKPGFGDETRGNISLRSGEVATLCVKLLAGTEKTEVTVIG